MERHWVVHPDKIQKGLVLSESTSCVLRFEPEEFFRDILISFVVSESHA